MQQQKDFPLIAIDLGGVIEDTWGSKQAWLASHGFRVSSPLERQSLRNLIGSELHQLMLQEVYSHEAMELRSPVLDCIKALKEISRWARITILTTRHPDSRMAVVNWLGERGLEPSFYRLVMLNDEALVSQQASTVSKLSWCSLHSCFVLIDDDMRHLAPLEDRPEIYRIHYQQGTSKPHAASGNLVTCGNWADILDRLKLLIHDHLSSSVKVPAS